MTNDLARALAFAIDVRRRVRSTTSAEVPHFQIDAWKAGICIEALLDELERVESELQIARGL